MIEEVRRLLGDAGPVCQRRGISRLTLRK
jgi:hypothetical protein